MNSQTYNSYLVPEWEHTQALIMTLSRTLIFKHLPFSLDRTANSRPSKRTFQFEFNNSLVKFLSFQKMWKYFKAIKYRSKLSTHLIFTVEIEEITYSVLRRFMDSTWWFLVNRKAQKSVLPGLHPAMQGPFICYQDQIGFVCTNLKYLSDPTILFLTSMIMPDNNYWKQSNHNKFF